MKLKRTVFLLTVGLLCLFLASASAQTEISWSATADTMLSVGSGASARAYFAGTFHNESDIAVAPGSGLCTLIDESGNVLATVSAACFPPVIPPGGKGYIRAEYPLSGLPDPDSGVAGFSFSFEPYPFDALSYTEFSPDCTLDNENFNPLQGYPVTVTIENDGHAPMENFLCMVYLRSNADQKPLYITETVSFYNRIPSGGHVFTNCYIPRAVLELLKEEKTDYSAVALLFLPN